MHALLTVLAQPGVAAVVAGAVTGGVALSTFALAQWFNARQQARARRREDNNKIEATVAEVVSAVIDLQAALAVVQPRWIAWRPRLLATGMAFLEFTAGRAAGGYAHGVVQSARTVMDWNNRSSDAAEALLREPGSRFFTAVSRAVLLLDRDIADAAARVAGAVTETMSSAAVVNDLYRRRAVEVRRAETEQMLQDALGALVQATQVRLRPPARTPRWRRPGRRPEQPAVVPAHAE